MQTLGNDVVAEVSSMEERREEVEVLNQVVGHYEYQIQLAETRRIARIRQGINTEMGFNADGDAAYIVEAKYDVAWPRMLLVLRKLGFDVKDLDKSNGLLFVTYNGDQGSWWDGLFSSDKELLKKGDYRLKVARAGADREWKNATSFTAVKQKLFITLMIAINLFFTLETTLRRLMVRRLNS